jgi:RecA/RadA recombinase
MYPLASRGLTHALGGGIGKGRMTLLYGNTSSGKSLLMMQSIGLWQKQGSFVPMPTWRVHSTPRLRKARRGR